MAADWWSGCGSCGRGSSPSLRAVRASSPPALRPGRGVLRLSAIGGVGNACALPLARSAAWAELERSVAPTSAAVERRKASGPDVGPLPRPTRFQVATSDCAARTWLDAPFGAPPPSALARDGEISLLGGGEQSSGADAPRERLYLSPSLDGEGRAPRCVPSPALQSASAKLARGHLINVLLLILERRRRIPERSQRPARRGRPKKLLETAHCP